MKIFHNNLKKNSKTITLRKKPGYVASNLKDMRFDRNNLKSLPSFSKEWKNIIYSYNKNNLKNIPMNNININKIIKNYLNLYFKDRKYINPLLKGQLKKRSILRLHRKRRNFLRRIYVSNAEIKHTNSKAIITLYIVNRERKIFQMKYLQINKTVSKHLIKRSFLLYNKICRLALARLATFNGSTMKFQNNYQYITKLELISKKYFVNSKLNYLTKFLKFQNTCLKKIWSFIISKYWDRYLYLLRKYDLLYSLNQYKFNKQIFLPLLSNILNKIIRKKIQYNIINLKSIAFHPDIFTNALALKIQKKKMNYRKSMSAILNRACLPVASISNIQNTSPYKYKDLALACALKDRAASIFSMLHSHNSSTHTKKNIARLAKLAVISGNSENKTIPSIVKQLFMRKLVKKNIDKLLGDSCNISQVHNTIYNSIGYKNMAGMRLEVKGRLSKRYRADRSRYSLRWKGGLKNGDSSYKGLSSVLFRGNSKSNVSYSMVSSKRHIGAFAVKGWISGK